MSARTHQIQIMNTSAFPSAPIFLPTSQIPFAPPGGQTSARTFPVIAAAHGKFTSYPPEHDDDDDDDDEQLLYTYATFHEEPVAALSVNKRHDDTWTLCIPVPIPEVDNPTLLALHYMIKYTTTCDNGNSTTQTDTILTTEALPEGVVTKNTDLIVYHKGDSETESTGFAPRMVDHAKALCLSTTLAIKCNGGGEQWSHYIDNQHITPNVRIIDDSHLYVVFHVNEYPTVQTVRSLSVKASATWQKEEVELKAIAEAERKAEEEAMRLATLEAERRAREDEERQARLEERQARLEEHRAREEEHQAREEEHQARELEQQAREEESQARQEEHQARELEQQAREEESQARREEHQARREEHQARREEHQARELEQEAREEESQARDEERRAREEHSVAYAPEIADENMQARIASTMEALGLDKCEKGYKFKKTSSGYVCAGGSHKVTFAQLGLK